MSNAAAALAHMQSQLLQKSSAHKASSLRNPNGPGQSWSSHRAGVANRVDSDLPGAHLLAGSQGQLLFYLICLCYSYIKGGSVCRTWLYGAHFVISVEWRILGQKGFASAAQV